jgi:MFS family permease
VAGEATLTGTSRASAWQQALIVAACFLSLATVLGVLYSFGDFLEPLNREFGLGRGATSLIFSATTFLFLALGILTGPLSDRYGARMLGVLGALAAGLGLYGASVAGSIWVVFASYGFGVGIATGCIYVPMIAAVGRRFDRHRGLAVGIAVTGIGVGTLVVPPIAARLIESLGWRGALGALAVPSTALLLGSALASGDRGHRGTGTVGFTIRSFTSRTFVVLYAATVLLSAAIWSGFVYVAPYAQSLGLTPVAAALLLSAIGVGGVVGRLMLASLTEWMPALRALKVAIVVSTLAFVFWIPGLPYAALFAFAVLVGAGQGGWIALIPSVLAPMFGLPRLGRSVGAYWTAGGIGAVLGPTMTGFLIDTARYPAAILSQVALAGAGCFLFLLLRAPRPAS